MLVRNIVVLGIALSASAWSVSGNCAAAPDQASINREAAQGSAADRKAMIQALEPRLQRLKATDPVQYQLEMALQKEFNSATTALCKEYAGIDHGSSTDLCVSLCHQYLYSYRTTQARQIDASALDLKRLPTPKASYSQSYFHGFASHLCSGMPPGVWKHRSAPKDCAQAVGNEIEHAIAGLIYDPRHEGNVCAGFGLPQ